MTSAAMAMVLVFTRGPSVGRAMISDHWPATGVTCSTLAVPAVTPGAPVRDRPGTMGS